MKFKVSIVFCLLYFIGITIAKAASSSDLQINEVMPSNVDCYFAEHDFPDSWIELYNPTDAAIDINGYTIQDSNELVSYKFSTHKEVASHGFLIISCDKKNTGLHTHFRLESIDGGTLTLKNAQGKDADQLDYPSMIAPNVAYGRKSEKSADWGWELKPTPGQKNEGGHSDILLPDPVFNISGQVMSASAKVKITMPDGDYPSDTKLYLTTDGLEPTTKSQSGTKFSIEVSSSTVIRAKLISASAISPRSLTNSYIFHPRETELPIVSIVTDADYLFGDKEGILSSAKTGGKYNYNYNWRRPLNIEYFDQESAACWFNQVGETAVSGMKSRAENQKSMKIYANKRFGDKRFDGRLWDAKPHVQAVKSFILRNGGGNSSSSRINDAVVQALFGRHIQDIDYQEYSPVIVYINGEYRGEFGLRERSNEDYVEANYGGLEDIEYVSQDAYLPSSTERNQTTFSELYNLYQSKSSTYESLAELIDVENFKNVLIAEMYASNHDYPHNNIFIWRPKTDDGKWRWILKDLDFFSWYSSTPVDFNMFKYLIGPVTADDFEYSLAKRSATVQSAKIYQKMMSFPEFSEPFIDAFATYLGDFLKPSVTDPLIDRMSAEIENEIEDTYNLYDYNYKEFAYRVRHLRQKCQKRPMIIYQQMADFYSLGNVIPMTLIANHADVRINGIGLTEGDFDGAYFSHRELRLSTGAENIGWKMETYRLDSKGVMKQNGATQTFDKPELTLTLKDYTNCDSVSFTTYQISASAFETRLRELGIKASECRDWSTEAAVELPEPQCAYANLTGLERLPESKDDELRAWMDFYDARGNRFRKRVLVSQQGGAGTNQQKKNLSVSFCEDEWIGDETTGVTIGDWVVQDGFHLKAFYNDYFRGIPAIGYKLYNQMTQTLGSNAYAWQRGITADSEDLDVYQQARCFPDAFPCVLYVNGSYYGTCAWQLRKHRRNMNHTKNVATHIHLDGTLNDKRLFQGSVDWQKFEVRNPKDLYYMDGTDYDGDNPAEIMDETSAAYTGKKKQVRCAEVKRHIISLSGYYAEISELEAKGANADEIRSTIEQRFDVTGMIDYMVFSLVTSNYDGFSKNWQWFTYDGSRWFVAPYDLDLTFGYNEDAQELWPAVQSSRKYDYRMENVDTNGPMLWVKKYYWAELCSRYAELRSNGVFTTENIMGIISNWYDRVGDTNRSAEWQKWPESPCLTQYTDSQQRIEEWIDERLSLEDSYLLETTAEEQVFCGGIEDNASAVKGVRPVKRYFNLLGQPVSGHTEGFVFEK